MTTAKLKKYRTKQLTKSKLINRLVTLSLILIMVLISIPKMALAQLFDDGEQQKVSGIPNASIKLPNTEYTESTVDLRVKVLGGEVKLNRTWVNGRWYINPAWSNLRFILDPLDNSVRTIDRAGTLYQRTGDANLYSVNQVYIKKTTEGWQWYDRQGNWINYDHDGRLTEYGDRNNVKVTFILDSEGRRTAIKDHHGELVYNFTYDNSERLTQVEDREGRTVSYQWTGGRLTKVTDVLGYEWLYGYDNNGQLNQKTEPDSGVIKITYTDSVPAPKTAMDSGKDKQQSESSVVSTTAKDKDTKLARVGKITDKTGAVTVYNSQYNRTNKQYTITVDDPMGKKTVTVLDAKGRTLSKTINDILWESYTRDEKNYLLKIKDQRGLITTIQYNQLKLPIKITYPNNTVENFTYEDKFGEKISYTNRSGIVTIWQYDDNGNLLRNIKALGKPDQEITAYSYDSTGQALTMSYGEGDSAIIIKYDYDRYGNLTSFTDGNNHTYKYTNNIIGQVVGITDPLGAKWSTDYNLAGQIIQTNDPLNNTKQFQRDFNGRIIKEINALGYITQYKYDFNSKGSTKTKIDPLNQTTIEYYDLLGRFIKRVTPSGLEEQQAYDNYGNIIKKIDPNGNIISLEYGGKNSGLEGLLTKINYPTYKEVYDYNSLGLQIVTNRILNSQEELMSYTSYDLEDNPVVSIDAAKRVNQSQYDTLGNLNKKIDALGNIAVIERDISGNIITLTDAKDQVYHFEYDKNNNLVSETISLGANILYSYDKVDQIIEQKDAEGNTINYQYDLAGRLLSAEYRKFGQTMIELSTAFEYDKEGQLIKASQNGTINNSFNYNRDELGRVIKETICYEKDNNKIIKEIQYSYTPEGDLASITYPDNSTLSYIYENGKIKQALLANGEKITWNDYEWDLPTEIIFPKVTQFYEYDSLQRPLSISVKANNQLLMERLYQYDKIGNVIKISTEKGNQVYKYDLLDRLVSVIPDKALQQQGLSIEGYVYDAVDNRIGDNRQIGDWIYNNKNQLVQFGENKHLTSLTYTPNGHVSTQKNTNQELAYIYNVNDRLESIKKNGIEIAQYQYDLFGRRIAKTVNGDTTYYIYSNEGLLAELNNQGDLLIAYGWEPNTDFGTSPLWQANINRSDLKSSDYNYIHVDHLGSAQMATNNKGDISWYTISDAFGKTIASSQIHATINLRFPGQYFDSETGLHYNYHRDYDPAIGRYIQSDPIGVLGGLNTYSYVLQNPVINSDNLGLLSKASCANPINAVACAYAGMGPVLRPKPTSKPKPKSEPKSESGSRQVDKPNKKPGYWSCKARADCNDNIPGNCPENPKQQFAFGTATEKNQGMARNTAKFWATQNLGCQPKHVRCSCTGPKGEQYDGGC